MTLRSAASPLMVPEVFREQSSLYFQPHSEWKDSGNPRNLMSKQPAKQKEWRIPPDTREMRVV